VQYQTPPLVIDGDAVGLRALQACRPRFKVFDYGVISLALMFPVHGRADLQTATNQLTGLDDRRSLGRADRRTAAALPGPEPSPTLSEDYIVYASPHWISR